MNPGLEAAIVQVHSSIADVAFAKKKWEEALAEKAKVDKWIQRCHDGWNDAIATQRRAEYVLERYYQR